jgi:hypothetical protein
MMSLIQHLKSANVQAADTYFAGQAIQRVELLLRSTRSAPGSIYEDARLKRIADAFQDLEEKKLLTQLDGLMYELDDTATLRLITGSRRIERVSIIFEPTQCTLLNTPQVCVPAPLSSAEASFRHYAARMRPHT